MNPSKYIYLIFITSIALIEGNSNNLTSKKGISTEVEVNVKTTHSNSNPETETPCPCSDSEQIEEHPESKLYLTQKNVDDNNDDGNSNNNKSDDSNNDSNGVHTINVLANSNQPIPANAQMLVLDPNRPVVISVKPGGPAAVPNALNNLNGLPIGALTSSDLKDKDPTPPLIPQNIVPAVKPVELSAGDTRILELIDQQPTLEGLSFDERNSQVAKYIEFLNLLREATLNQTIKLPRLVFIGDDDEIKYKVIDDLIGLKGCLAPTKDALVLSPRFTAPIRFTLVNDLSVKELKFKIEGTSDESFRPLKGASDLFKAIQDTEIIKKSKKNFLLSEIPIEITIYGSSLPSLVFMDLPWKAPDSNDKTVNEGILARLLHKYLGQAWGMVVGIGNGSHTFEQWKCLSLMRTFDKDLKRIFLVGVNPPSGEDSRIQGLVMGLQESIPDLNKKKIFYLGTETTDNNLKTRSFCDVAVCGQEDFVKGLQLRLLRTWNSMRMDANRIIQSAQDQLNQKIIGYNGYWQMNNDKEKQWSALVGQVIPILQQIIVFMPEDRDTNLCSGSPLDLVKKSIFDVKNPQSDSENSLENKKINWSNIFANYQSEISDLQRHPDTVDWETVRSGLDELRTVGPNQTNISKLKQVLLAQLDALQVPKTRLIEVVKLQWKDAISNGIDNKPSLEPFPEFKSAVLKSVDELLSSQLKILSELNKQLNAADETVGWSYRFSREDVSGLAIWMDLMKAETPEATIELFKKISESGFVEICSRQAIQQPRLIISNLLTRKIATNLIERIRKAKDLKMTDMSSESIKRLTLLQNQLEKYLKLIQLSSH